MKALRLVLIAIGVVAAAYGAKLLLDDHREGTVPEAAQWLIGGVVLHDAVLAPLTVLVGWAAARLLPPSVRRPGTLALIVLGPLTLVAVPVLGRFGAHADNPSLLDRPYLAGWLICVAVVVAAVIVGELVVRSRGHRPSGSS